MFAFDWNLIHKAFKNFQLLKNSPIKIYKWFFTTYFRRLLLITKIYHELFSSLY